MDTSEEKMEKQASIVIVGGGFGGLFTALSLAGAGRVTLVSNEDHFLHTPLLYEYLSGEVEAWHIAPPYRELLDERLQFVQGAVTDVDLDRKEVAVAGRVRRINYDYLVLAVGGVTNFWGIEGAEQNTLPFRKIRHADELRRRMCDALDRIPPDAAPQDARRSATFVIAGGGASGVELSTKMADLLRDAFRRRGLRGEPRVVIVEMGKQLVPGMGDELRAAIEKVLDEKRVEVHTDTRVVEVLPRGVTFEHAGERQTIESEGVVWTAGVRVNPLVERLDVEKTQKGLVVVAPTLQVRGRAEVFVLGDIANSPNVAPTLAGTAQLAYQQSRLVARNIQALIDGSVPSAGHFEEMGEAVSLGTDDAAVLIEGRVVSGQLARQARFALYTLRLPTWHQRLRVGAAWFFGGKSPRPLGL
ncbi:MAG TPA: NAD(P)/FAD-dependent oxidoreductase [Pyrinomonadaceae bacterium]|jgi:NADH dehydrogenase|nr:NAD(P)/FAD-dependent oxidoreductase [Pyrinomonadaceae bacterium]